MIKQHLINLYLAGALSAVCIMAGCSDSMDKCSGVDNSATFSNAYFVDYKPKIDVGYAHLKDYSAYDFVVTQVLDNENVVVHADTDRESTTMLNLSSGSSFWQAAAVNSIRKTARNNQGALVHVRRPYVDGEKLDFGIYVYKGNETFELANGGTCAMRVFAEMKDTEAEKFIKKFLEQKAAEEKAREEQEAEMARKEQEAQIAKEKARQEAHRKEQVEFTKYAESVLSAIDFGLEKRVCIPNSLVKRGITPRLDIEDRPGHHNKLPKIMEAQKRKDWLSMLEGMGYKHYRNDYPAPDVLDSTVRTFWENETFGVVLTADPTQCKLFSDMGAYGIVERGWDYKYETEKFDLERWSRSNEVVVSRIPFGCEKCFVIGWRDWDVFAKIWRDKSRKIRAKYNEYGLSAAEKESLVGEMKVLKDEFSQMMEEWLSKN